MEHKKYCKVCKKKLDPYLKESIDMGICDFRGQKFESNLCCRCQKSFFSFCKLVNSALKRYGFKKIKA